MHIHTRPQVAQVPLLSYINRCYAANTKPLTFLRALSESFVAKAQDIEEMVSLGNRLSSCPYYASRLLQP